MLFQETTHLPYYQEEYMFQASVKSADTGVWDQQNPHEKHKHDCKHG